MTIYRFVRLLCLSPFFLGVCGAQYVQTGPQIMPTGIQSHGTMINKGADVINAGNNNIYLNIPIINKQGRGTPFTYNLSLNSSIWTKVQSGSAYTWIPVTFDGSALGWQGINPQASQGASYNENIYTSGCQKGSFTLYVFQSFGYLAPTGDFHALSGAPIEWATPGPDSSNCPSGLIGGTSASSSLQSHDGSGYTGTMSLQGNGATGTITFQLQDAHGRTISPPVNTAQGTYQGSLTTTDNNGNQITANAGQYTDTTGTQALSVVYHATSTSPPNPHGYTTTTPANTTLQYNLPGGTASYEVVYTTANVATNFQCSGIGEYGPVSTNLVSRVILPDGTFYQFGYEPTGGGSGSTTGRVSSVTLPTGGTITYAYSGGSNGISCGGGSTPILTRTTTDGQSTYNRANADYTNPINTVTDEKGNQSIYTFHEDTSYIPFGFYETHRQIYQGSVSGIPLEEVVTCYNGATSQCDNGSSVPFTEIDATSSFNGSHPLLTKTTYDSYGVVVTNTAQYSGSTLLESVANTYPGNGPPYLLSSSTTTDGSGNTVALTSYGYDEGTLKPTSGLPQHAGSASNSSGRGNLTSTHASIDGTSTNTLNTSTVFYDTGQPYSTTTPSGTTTYIYESTQTFVNSTTLPTSASGAVLSTSANYDIASGVPTYAQGMNPNQITNMFYDSMLRATSVSTPESGQLTTIYAPNQISSLSLMSAQTQTNSSQSTDQETFLDGYGRTTRISVSNGSSWYLTDTCYDADGLIQFHSVQYLSASQNPSGNNCSSSLADQYAYDALGRKTSVSHPDGSSESYTYNQRAVEMSTSTGISKITQYDFLGRISNVCELSSNSSMPGSGPPIACNADIAGTGFTTNYAYNLQNHTTTITQGQQTRVFQTDAIGRTILMSEPEAGTTTYSYSYNTTGLSVVRTRPQANIAANPAPSPIPTTSTTLQYDSVGRLISVTYSDGTPNKYFGYDETTAPDGHSLGSSMGQETSMSVQDGNGTYHRRSYTYDIMGRVSETEDCLPDWCGTNANDVYRWYTYNLASMLSTEKYNTAASQGSPVTIGYGYNQAGQVISLSGGQNNSPLSPSIYSTTSMTPGGATAIQFGNGLYTPYIYNALNLVAGGWVCSGSAQPYCSGGTQIYGYVDKTVGGQVASMSDLIINEAETFSYDEFGRLSGQNHVANANNTSLAFVYDRYGNRWQQNATAGTAPQPQLLINPVNNQVYSYQYDVAGNVTNDGSHTYTYDAENNLIAVDNGSTAIYTYDALNERVKVSTSGGVEHYGFDLSGRRSTSWNSSAALDSVQYYAGSNAVAYWLASDGNIHFEHQDWLGTERMRTNASAIPEGYYRSLPFGDAFTVAGSDDDAAHFALLDHDLNTSSGLEHATFREYSSTAGRWMSPDSYTGSYDIGNPQSFNRYAYVSSSPLTFTDPSGQVILVTCSNVEALFNGNAPPSILQACERAKDLYFLGLESLDMATKQQFGSYLPPNALNWGGGAGGGGGPRPAPSPLPNNQKSDARKQCEQKAQQQFEATKTSLVNNALPKAKAAIIPGARHGFYAGCVAGAVLTTETTPAGMAAACLNIGASSAIINAVAEPAMSLLDDGLSLGQAALKLEFKMDLCSLIP